MVTEIRVKSEEILKDYILSCMVECKSTKTISTYEMVINNFLWYCHEYELPELTDITPTHIRGFLYYLQTEPNRWGNGNTTKPASKTTVNDYYRALRTFFNWCERECFVIDNPFLNIKPPKTEDKIIEILTPEEIKTLLGFYSRKTSQDMRNKAILSIFMDCGLRLSELTALNVADIDLDSGMITIRHAKGGKQRTVGLGRTALLAVRKYVLYHRKSDTDALFINRFGRRLESRGIKIFIKRLKEHTGIKVHPHKFRHTFAVNFLRNGGDIYSLKHLLGHSSLQMTLRYLQCLSANDAVRVNRIHSPLDNL